MALLDRIGPNGNISVHAFSSAIYLMERGIITSGQIISRLGLSQNDQIQLAQIDTFYNTLSATEKAGFYQRFESLNVLLEQGYITLSEYKNLLGIT